MATLPPDREVLLNYLQGKLSDAESDRIAQLVDDDPAVRAQLEELDRSGDTFIEMLRQDDENTPGEGVSECADVLDRAKKLLGNQARQKHGLGHGFNVHEQGEPTRPGTLGEYELIERIGQGGMGVVFKARHTKLGRTVAIKVIVENRAADDRAIVRFEREIKAIGQLNHPSIVHAHDAREIDGRSILVMEYIDGLDLGRLIRRHGPVATADACELIRQTSLGLQAAHEHGLVHRDIKPSNLMLDRRGNVKILDLGLAREATDIKELRREISMSFDLTQTGQAMGTADYMAPEQATNPAMVDIRADIYSLGCTLFKLLTGRAPYHEEMTFDKLTAHAEVPLPPTPSLPDPLRAILERMTAKDPADRFSTPEEVAHALEPYCAGHDLAALLALAESQTAPAYTLPRPSSGGRFRRVITILLLMAFAGGFGLFGGIILKINRDGKETKVEVPTGSTVAIDEKGDVAVKLPPTATDLNRQKFLDPTENETDRQRLNGTRWRLVAGSEDGEYYSPLTESHCKIEFFFDGDYIKFIEDGEEVKKVPFILDTTTTPKRISWPDGMENYSIYKIEGNILTICVRDPKQKGHPTSFTSDSAQGTFVLAETTNAIPVYWHIVPLLSPIKLQASAFYGGDRGVTLDVASRPDQVKRWAGKTLRVTYPKGFNVNFSTEGSNQNVEKRWVQWTVPEETFGNEERAYQVKFQALPKTQGTFEFLAELLDAKAQPVWSNKVSCNLQLDLPQRVEPIDKNKEDRQNLFGLWRCVSAKIGGQTVTAKDLANLKIAINETYIYRPTSWEQGYGRGAAGTELVIDATTNPKRMNFPYDSSYGHDGRLNSYSIYQLEDDRLTISFPLHPYPTNFASESNSSNVQIVFERVKGPLPDSTPIADRAMYKLLFPSLVPDEGPRPNYDPFPSTQPPQPAYPSGTVPNDGGYSPVEPYPTPNSPTSSYPAVTTQTTSKSITSNSPVLPGVWKLVERPNREGCLIVTGKEEKTPEVTVTFTDKELYLRGDAIVNRRFRYEASPDGKNINLSDGRNQVYRGVMSVERDGKRLVLVCSAKTRPTGTWEYFGTDFDRLVLEKTDAKPDATAFAFDKSLDKKWFLMTTRPAGYPNYPSVSSEFLAGQLCSTETENGLFYLASANFSSNGYLTLNKLPYLQVDEPWPKRFACDIDTSTTPKRMDVVMDDRTAMKGIYRTEGDRLYLRFTTGELGRPKDFKVPTSNDLVELEFCSPTSTPELTTVLMAKQGTVVDGDFLNYPYTVTCISDIKKRFEKHPDMKVVIDASHASANLIVLRRRLLDVGVKSVQIKSGDQHNMESLFFCRFKNLPKFYGIPDDKLDTLHEQLPKVCGNQTSIYTDEQPILSKDDSQLTQSFRVQKVDVTSNTIQVTLDPTQVKSLQKIKLDPSEKVAVLVGGGGMLENLIIAVTTFESLQKGSFKVDCQLEEEERKVLIHALKATKEPQGMGGGMGGMGTGMF